MAFQRHTFTVTLSGFGRDADAAWQDAVEGFSQDPGATPDEFELGEDLEQEEGEGTDA